MRLLIAGNLANTGFYLTNELRKKGLDAYLLMEKNPVFESDPRNSGFLSNDEYPDWIIFWNRQRNWKREIILKMRKFDLISAATELPIFALFALKPYIAIATGSDLSELAQQKTLKGMLLRTAYKRAKIVVYNLPSQMEFVEKLKLKNAIFLPLFRDFEKEYNNENPVKEIEDKFIFFHPTNHDWNIKKNDIFLRAYIELCKKRDDVFLILINRGPDYKKSIELLKKVNIEGKYKILPKSLNQNELHSYYNHCDVIVDQFGVGAFGFIGIEVMSMGKPLICYIKENNFVKLYGEKPPIISGNNEKEILEYMNRLVDSNQFCNEVGINSKKWISKYHSKEILIQKYIDLFNMVNSKSSYNEIKKHLEFN